MIGQYTQDEINTKIELACNISDVKDYINGLVILVVGRTKNYYRREQDGSWTNYDCKTIG